MNANKILRAVVALLVLGTALTACGGRSSSDSSLTVVFAAPSFTPESAAFLAADELGYYEEEGIDVTFELAPSGTQALQQVASGAADIAVLTAEPAVVARSKGSDVKFFLPYWGRFIYQLATVPGSDVAAIADLKGARIGVSNPASTGVVAAKSALRTVGLDESDVTFVPIGVGAQQASAIEQGSVDALALWDTQYTILANAGIETSTIETPDIEGLFGGGALAKGDRLAKESDLFERWGKATTKGILYAAKFPESALDILWKVRPETRPAGNVDQDLARKGQAAIIRNRMSILVPDSTSTDFVRMSDEQAQSVVDFAVSNDLIPDTFDGAELLMHSLESGIADVDPSDVTEK